MKVAIYCRVSTDQQSTDMQKRELTEYCKAKGWTITTVYEDQRTGTNTNRPAFQRLMADARQKQFDAALVYKVDRMARSLKDLIVTLQELIELKVEFVSLKDNIDMTTSAGRLMFNIIGAFSQFEVDIIRERTRSGLKNAQAKGVQLGRPVITNRVQIRRLRSKGMKLEDIAVQCKTSLSTVKRALRAVS